MLQKNSGEEAVSDAVDHLAFSDRKSGLHKMDQKKYHEGFFYVATGQRHYEEAILSAYSLKNVMPHAAICVFTDIVENRKSCFDIVINVDSCGNGYLDKIKGFSQSPFDRSIFIDTDVLFCESVEDLFDLLDVYNIAAAFAPCAPDKRGLLPPIGPNSFYELNTGVVVFRATTATAALFADWERLFADGIAMTPSDAMFVHDQPAFRAAVWRSGLPIYILPPDYNFRTICPSFARSKVKILHGRHTDMASLIQLVNEQNGARVFPEFKKNRRYSQQDILFLANLEWR